MPVTRPEPESGRARSSPPGPFTPEVSPDKETGTGGPAARRPLADRRPLDADIAEEPVVARRVVTIDPAGEDGDRHPTGHHRHAVRAAVDAERPAGDDRPPTLGQRRGHLGTHVRERRRSPPGCPLSTPSAGTRSAGPRGHAPTAPTGGRRPARRAGRAIRDPRGRPAGSPAAARRRGRAPPVPHPAVRPTGAAPVPARAGASPPGPVPVTGTGSRPWTRAATISAGAQLRSRTPMTGSPGSATQVRAARASRSCPLTSLTAPPPATGPARSWSHPRWAWPRPRYRPASRPPGSPCSTPRALISPRSMARSSGASAPAAGAKCAAVHCRESPR